MRRILSGLLLILFMALFSTTRAAAITVCRVSADAYIYRFTGIDWTLDTLHYVADGATIEGDTLTAWGIPHDNGDGIVFINEAFVGYYLGNDEWFMLKGTPSTPLCGQEDGSGEPDGGLESVTFDVAPGCYTWQLFDNVWHDVRLKNGSLAETCSQEEEGRVFVRLPLVKGSVTDPDRYRVWRVGG